MEGAFKETRLRARGWFGCTLWVRVCGIFVMGGRASNFFPNGLRLSKAVFDTINSLSNKGRRRELLLP
jgi:hypothetical protein